MMREDAINKEIEGVNTFFVSRYVNKGLNGTEK